MPHAFAQNAASRDPLLDQGADSIDIIACPVAVLNDTDECPLNFSGHAG